MVPMRGLSPWIPRLSASLRRFASAARLLAASGTPRVTPSAPAPRLPAPSSPSRRIPPFPRRNRHMASSSGVKGEDLQRKPPSVKDFIISLGSTQGKENVENVDTAKIITRYSYVPPADSVDYETEASGQVIFAEEDASRKTLEVMDSKPVSELSTELPDDVMEIFENSSHRDGSIYCGTDCWKSDYDISDRRETWLEAMMLSDPIDCEMDNGTCESHISRHMLQFLSLRLAKVPAELGSVELYGYIAVRDNLNPLLNYIVNFSRDDPIIVKQGSLIYMSGPKRAIELIGSILIEFDMKIKAGEHENEDLQVIDGVSILDHINTCDRRPFTFRIQGDCGAIDVGASRLSFAYEGTIEVVISQVQSSFSMRLGCFTSGLNEEIRLFDGAVGESRGLKRAVVAVSHDGQMELKFKVATDSSTPAEYSCCFQAKQHGHATQEINTGFALVTVKVTWSALIREHFIATEKNELCQKNKYVGPDE